MAGTPIRLSTVRLALAEASARLTGASPSDPSWKETLARHLGEMPTLAEDVWQPFPLDHRGPPRRIRFLDTGRALGEGTFGIVFPMVYELPAEDEQDRADPRVVLAAMKMLPLLKHHGLELISLLAANDLVRAGCTPCLIRMIDSFCITTVATITTCRMPPNKWGMWRLYDRFIYRAREKLVECYGENILRSSGTNDETGTARLNAGATVGFIFTELSPSFLLPIARKISLPATELTPPRPGTSQGGGGGAAAAAVYPSIVEAAEESKQDRDRGLTDLYSLVAHMFMRLHALDALHASGALHRDVHSGNFIHVPTTAFRTPYCALESREGRELRLQWLGEPGRSRPDDQLLGTEASAGQLLYFRGGDEEFNRYVVGIDTRRSNGLSCLIDLGTASRPTFAEGAVPTRDQVVEVVEEAASSAHTVPRHLNYFFGAAALASDHVRIGNFRTMSATFAERYARDRTPAFSVVTFPTTLAFSRCTEQLNPLVVPGLAGGQSEFAGGAHYIALHSEFSDVYSMAEDLATLILGYHPFANFVPASLASSSQSLRQSIKGSGGGGKGADVHCRSRGPRISPFVASRPQAQGRARGPPPSHLQPLRESGSLPASRSSYQPQHPAVLTGLLWPYLSSSGSDAEQERLVTEALARGEIVQFRKDYSALTGQLLKFMHLRLFEERKRGASATAPCHFFGEKDTDLLEVATAIAARIDAVGLPLNLDGLRNTFFYDFFCDKSQVWKIKEHIEFYDDDDTSRRSKRGWLYLALHETLTNKWRAEKIVATDLVDRLVDALSFDPADRPSLDRLMRCNLFVQTLGISASAAAAAAAAAGSSFATQTLWSSKRPRLGTVPDFCLDPGKPPFDMIELERRFCDATETDGTLLQLPTPVARARFTELHWTFSAIRNVARLRYFRYSQGRLPGFLARYQASTMRLLPSESALAALYNFRTGLLDYFDGSLCVRLGQEKRADVFEDADEMPNVHFKSHLNMAEYIRFSLAAIQHRADSLPSWPFVRALDLKRDYEPYHSSISSSSSSATSTSSPVPSGQNPDEIVIDEGQVDSVETPPPSPPRPTTGSDQERPSKRRRLEA
jgi:serine/threonine protein kinase